ncbi:DUF4244 domain-containing protein [Arthrobacter pigmenti]
MSYRKARTAPESTPGQTVHRTSRSTRGTAYRVAGTGRTFQSQTLGTSAMQPGAVFGDPHDETSGATTTTDRPRHDNVVELFPGAAGTASAPGRGNWLSRLKYAEAGMATAEYAITTLGAVLLDSRAPPVMKRKGTSKNGVNYRNLWCNMV